MIKLIVLVFLVIIMPLYPVFAEEASSSTKVFNQESINPDSFFYSLKRGWEKIESFVVSFNTPTNQKFQKDLSQVRLNELAYIAENKKYGQFKEASSRYVTLLQEMMANKNSLTENEKQKLSEKVESLKKIQQKYSGDYAYWSFLQQAIETSQKYLSQ